jgi:RecB family endonuclease NucS
LPESLRGLHEPEFRRLQVLEKTLEDFLEFNLELLEKGLAFIARQHPTSTGPLDILARDARGRWLVIELKKGRAADRVVGQLLRYMDFIITEKANGNASQVRGFIVAPDPDSRLVAAVRGAGRTPLAVYEFCVQGRVRRLHPSVSSE